MDQACFNCTQTTDNTTGACRFCGAPFSAVQEAPLVEEVADLEPEVADSKRKGKKVSDN